jgi:SWI/SNF-related matrix-associated actin-dependent regulator 1 of chromatin subfamily A
MVMVQIGICKDIAARGKVPDVIEYLRDAEEQEEKMVLFLHQHSIHDAIKKSFPHAVSVTGQQSLEERQKSIDKFQNDPSCLLILCSLQAAGVGINLTASSRVGFIEQGWHAAIMDQAEDRVHRNGATGGKSGVIQVINFLASNTYDEKLYNIVNEKREMSDDATGANSTQVDTSVLNGLMELLTYQNQTNEQNK